MSDKTPEPGAPGAIHPLARRFLWLDRQIVRDGISLGVVLIAMILLAVDFFVDRHGETWLANIKGFFPVFGFVCFAFAVLMGWPLRAILMKRPDYYGESEDSDA